MNFTLEFKSISDLITQFRAITAKDSITPEAVGYILQRIASLAHDLSNPSIVADAESVVPEVTAQGVTICFNTRNKDGSLNSKRITIPVATNSNAGVISAEQFHNIAKALEEANKAKDIAETATSAAGNALTAASNAVNTAKAANTTAINAGNAAEAASKKALEASAAAQKALEQAFDVVKFTGLLPGVPSSWTHVADASGVKSTDSGYDVLYDSVNKRMMLLSVEDGKATYYTHWSDADKFGVGSGSFGSYYTFKPFEHKIYSNDKILYVYDGEQMIPFANLADASILQDAFDAAAVKTFDDLWTAIGGSTTNKSYTDPDGNLIGDKKSAYSQAVKYFIEHVKNDNTLQEGVINLGVVSSSAAAFDAAADKSITENVKVRQIRWRTSDDNSDGGHGDGGTIFQARRGNWFVTQWMMFEGVNRICKVRYITTGGNYSVSDWHNLIIGTDFVYDMINRMLKLRYPQPTTGGEGSVRDIFQIPLASTSYAGFMSPDDKLKLNGLSSDTATTTKAGLMSAADKKKLNEIGDASIGNGAHIGVMAIDGRIRVYGADKLIAAGYVPYVFRKAKIKGRFRMTYHGDIVETDRENVRLPQKKGWRVHGSYRAYRIVDGELQFSTNDKHFWSDPGEEFSGEVRYLVHPEVVYDKMTKGYELFVPYGRRRIYGGLTTDLRHGLRNLRIEYALAFGLPIESRYHPVTPADMITPLMTFSAIFSNAQDDENKWSAAQYWDEHPIYWDYKGWTFGN